MNLFGHAVPVVLDLECDDLSAKHCVDTRVYLVGLHFLADYGMWCEGTTYYDTYDNIRHWLIELAADPTVVFIIHNASFDVPVLRIRGIPITRYFCTMVASHTWCPKSSEENSLAALTGTKVDLRQALTDTGTDLSEVPKGDEYRMYGTSDAVDKVFCKYLEADLLSTATLYRQQLLDFATDERALSCLLTINIPYVEVIIELEQGTVIDRDKLTEVQDALSAIQEAARQELLQHVVYVPGKEVSYVRGYHKRNGEVTYDHCTLQDFNPGSSDHVAYVLTKLYDWKPHVLSEKTGKPSVSTEVIEALPYPFVSALLRYQKAAKLMQFVPQIQDNISDGVIVRPSYNQCATRTTRLSCSRPNIQQIPSRDEAGKQLRSLFVAPAGYKLVAGDMAGLQLRIMGWYMQFYFEESRLCDVFTRGDDVHQFFADIYGIDRKIGKNVTFGYCFGAGAVKMAATASRGGTQVSVDIIRGALSSLQDRLPALPALKELVVRHARDNNCVIHDWLGQRYVIHELVSKDKKERASGERKCFNYWVQGFEATLYRYLQLKARPTVRKYGAKAVFVVHDEAAFIVRHHVADEFASVMSALFTTDEMYPRGVPNNMKLDCTFTVVNNWLEAK